MGQGTTSARHPRKLSDITLTPELTQEQVTEIWGEPETHRGSGVDYLAYKLEDDRELRLSFLPNPPHEERCSSSASGKIARESSGKVPEKTPNKHDMTERLEAGRGAAEGLEQGNG